MNCDQNRNNNRDLSIESNDEIEELEKEISVEEVTKTIDILKKNSSSGPKNLVGEVFIALKDIFFSKLY